MTQKDDIIEIDLLQLLQAIWRHFGVVILFGVICGGIAFVGTHYLITPKYEASSMMYVNNNSFNVGSTSFSISDSELTAAQNLVSTYIVILNTRTTLNEVIEKADSQYTFEELKEMISAKAVNSTEIFEVTVTSADPYEAEKIANIIAKVLPDKIADVVEGSSVRIVDYAVVPAQRSSPSYTINTLLGVLIGVVITVTVIVFRKLFDVYIRSQHYLTRAYDLPLLAVIPDMRVSGGAQTSTTPKKKRW